MKNFPTFNNPPITEALVDIKVTQAEDVSIEKLLSLHEIVKTEYPQKNVRRAVLFKIQRGEVPAGSAENLEINGYLFRTSDQKQIVQFRKDGFTFNRLKPYDKWEILFVEAKRLWEIYKEKTNIISYDRLAVRYINVIEIPLSRFTLSDYFNFFPNQSENKPGEESPFCESFLLQQSLVLKNNVKANIKLASQNSPNVDISRFLLDIDVYLNKENLDESKIIETIERLKEVEDELFFSSITDKTKELFK